MFFLMFILALIISALYLIHTLYRLYLEKFNFWTKLGVQHIKPDLPLGNVNNFIFRKSKPIGIQQAQLYKHFKSKKQQFFGYYFLHFPVFIPIDIDLIKYILTRDFSYFDEKNLFVNEELQPISANLFQLGGAKWRHMRVKLTPAFTSGKIKLMLPILLECRKPMLEHIEHCTKSKFPLDIKAISNKFTIDVIGSAAFGIDCNSFKNDDSEFYVHGRRAFGNSFLDTLKLIFTCNFQDIARRLGMGQFPQGCSNFYTDVIRSAIKYRKDNNVTKNDYLQMLIKLYDDGQINFGEVVAQAFVFFIAGYETSALTMTFCLFELAQNQDIQDRVRDEIIEVLAKYNGQITYEALGELKYMKQVIDETLRKHPLTTTIDRKCSKEYKIEGKDIIIPVGTAITLPSYAIHHDPEYYPNPEKFDPDRFSETNVANRKSFTYLPFGGGPRICLGLRFGIMQTKIGLLALLRNYRYTLNHKTSPNLEYEFKFILSPMADILLDVEEVE